MALRLATRLKSYFEEYTNGDLRGVIMYDRETYNVVYLREDVAEEYTDREFADAVDDSRVESLMRPVYKELLTEDHGELLCVTKCFTGVTEMNFVVSDGVGALVSFDSDALLETDGLVAEAQRIVLDEQEEFS